MRKKRMAVKALFLIAAIFMGCDSLWAKGFKTLVEVEDVPLPGGTTRFDYQGLDPDLGRLFLSHMGDGELVVFDTKARKVLARLPGFSGVTGVLAIPSLGRIYASVPGKKEVVALDARTLKEVSRVPAGEFPDGLAFAPPVHKVFVSDELGGKETVIDVISGRTLDQIDMGGEVGNTQWDSVTGRIDANVQTRNELVEIDASTDKVIARHALKGGLHNHGLLVDAPARLAFIACDGDNRLLAVDLTTFQTLQDFPVGNGPDVLAFDPGLNRLYVACEDGATSIFQLQKGRLEKMEDAEVGYNAHTILVDPRTRLVYLPLKNVEGRPLLRILGEKPSPH